MSFLDKLFGENKEGKGLTSNEQESTNFFDIDNIKDTETIEEIIKYNDFNILKTKINSSNCRQADDNFKMPLYYATINKRIEVIKYLFELGCDFEDAKEMFGGSAITTIINTGNKEVLKTFIDAGYKVISGKSAVMAISVENAPLDFIEYLIELDIPMDSLERKISKDLIDEDTKEQYEKYTPLEFAVFNNREYEVLEVLIQAGCPLNEEKNINFVSRLINTSLSPSTKAKTLHLLNRLNKLDLNIKDEEGNNLVKQAINVGDTRSLKELILLGADFSDYTYIINNMLTIKDLEYIIDSIKSQGKNIDDFLCLFVKSRIESYMQEYDDLSHKNIVYQIVINTRLKENEKVELLQIALSKKADINFTVSDDKNTLFIVCKNLFIGKDICVAKFLLENGAKIEYGGNSALFHAISEYNIPLIELLLSFNANTNFVNNEKEGVINYFYKEHINLNSVVKKREVLQLLINSGLNINTQVKYETKDKKFEDELISFFAIFCIENEFRLIDYIFENNIEIKDEESIYYAIKYLKKDILLKEIIKINPYYERKDYYERFGEKSNANIIHLAFENYLSEEFIYYVLETYPTIKAYNEIEPIALDIVKSRFYSLEIFEKIIKKDNNINRYYIFEIEDDTLGEYLSKGTLLLCLAELAKDLDKNNKYFKAIQILLENGADINLAYKFEHNDKRYAKGHSIFIRAKNENRLNKELYDLFYKYGGSLIKPVKECFNEFSIHSIVRFLHDDKLIVEYLDYCWEKEPFDLEYKNSMNSTILLNAAMSCNAKVLKWLANKGANIHIVGGFDNCPALHKAIANYSFIDPLQRLDSVKTLLDLGVDIEQFDSDQMTPLMVAANVGTTHVLKELLQRGADVNHVNENNESAIHFAVLGKYSYDLDFRFETIKSKIITDLVNAKADINLVSDNGATALIYAIDYGYREIFDTLINFDADVNQACSHGYTPLYYATLIKDRYFINKLYATNKLDVNKVNEFNFTVLHQIVNLDIPNEVFKNMLIKLIEMGLDINYHKDIEPALLMYIKTMEFVGDRQVGFVSSKKKPKEIEHKKVEIFIEYGADLNLCLEFAKKQNEPKDIFEYLESLI
ncbi:hypothetical protein CRV00_01415 [Malaciobacter molluscorum]|uniref:ankyrin repeat domain-containing protein n=1 Tax=Malaciobacter molluscorum TaxID=1032072 RepID=UPI00100AA403|nr:ankyrin repeat domain-containing protein [Malaciobacter molluscorum]RXJ96307.1 hypothetical protein CRV00_01415 [Malaciobacter molluscorum]